MPAWIIETDDDDAVPVALSPAARDLIVDALSMLASLHPLHRERVGALAAEYPELQLDLAEGER